MIKKRFDREFEEAIRFLSQVIPDAEELIKPTLLHSVRVGIRLFTYDLPREVCLAGLLHDVLEDTPVTEKELEKLYGKEVLDIVFANTKNETINDKNEKTADMINRCILSGKFACLVKAADILDNFDYAQRVDRQDWIEQMTISGSLLLESLPKEYTHELFNQLRTLVDDYQDKM